MTDSPARTESLGDSADDNQLTIRIPNPKVFMARQSQWKGRRGKPRCDHCRLNNLKCDRVLPTCNHCSWANRPCKYTPLPTPAHRGIPRCDRCRHHNLKCDRNLPVCNHCTEGDDGEPAECNYTPKKRHKVPTDHAIIPKDRPSQPYAAKTASFLVSDKPSEERFSTGNWIAEHPENFTRGKLPDGLYEISSSSAESDDDDDDIEEELSPRSHSIRAKYENSWAVDLPRSRSYSSGASGSRHRYEGTRHLEPWYHPAFAPLPRGVLQGIRTMNPSEVPTRQEYDEALFRFLTELPIELREISAFAPDGYAELAQAVANADTTGLSTRVQSWVRCHHVRSGSRKYHLLLLPQESYFSIRQEKEEKLRLEYIAEVDGDAANGKAANGGTPGQRNASPHEGSAAFIRVPVSPQIYDVLVYAHKSHLTASATLAQVRQAGIACITWPMVELFHRLCPVCSTRGKPPAQ
ncbi:hypothetical protein BV25DRAFT_1905810 [Artomyces pyxidatus]|uniref:Uncharacterized protein n=1 Tax=Artomyces pyxidatus TaxID=48021 RepID=A0ACB8TCV1_9AGAM|nr:hypothetical protein BV25DRAFT_1905810 [Artomyces pyxidatus]